MISIEQSICHLLRKTPTEQPEGLEILNFVYETDFATLKQPPFLTVYQMLFVSNGKGEYLFRGRRYPLSRGCVFFIFPNEPYKMTGDENLLYYYITFTGTAAGKLLSSMGVTPDAPFYPNEEEHLAFWQSAIREVRVRNLSILTQSVLTYTLSLLSTERPNEGAPEVRLTEEIRRYVDTHFGDRSISLAKLAQIFSYNEKYICTVFHKVNGKSFRSYLRAVRMNAARKYLKSGKSVAETALLVGYGDPLYFSKVFREETGLTASAYQRTLAPQLPGPESRLPEAHPPISEKPDQRKEQTSMKDPIRFGIVGGKRGLNFYQSLASDDRCRVTAYAEISAEFREKIRAEVSPEVQIFADAAEMIHSGLCDAVILANYFHEHARLAILAMNAGLDVVSDTTAAPTLGECLDLVETAEKTGKRFMLAANCPVMPGAAELKKVYERGELGAICYAEAEYLHSPVGDELDLDTARKLAPGRLHWRRYLPGLAYNMHSLGVLMEITGLLPRSVIGTDVDTGGCGGNSHKMNQAYGGVGLYTMEGGAIFRTTGSCSFGAAGKYYRLSCRFGTVETQLDNQDKILYRIRGKGAVAYDPDTRYEEWEKSATHGGADGRICRKMLDYLYDNKPIFFDVYNSASLSAAGILGLYSTIDEKSYSIPDFHNREEREICRGDYRTPFPNEEGYATLPCNHRHAVEAGFRVDTDDGTHRFYGLETDIAAE